MLFAEPGQSLPIGDVVDPEPTDVPVIGTVTKDAGTVSFSFPAGVTFDVEYSRDLESWDVIETDVTGIYEDADAARSAEPSGYYRGVRK